MQIFPLTQTQLGIYLAETAADGKGDYNIDLVYYLDKNVDIERLQTALKVAVNKHPYIKSQLAESEEGEIVLEDHSDDEALVMLKTAPNREAVLAEIGRPFNMLHNTLYRLVIYTLDNGEHILYMDFHHILCDGMSCTNFHNEVGETYDKLGKNAEIECVSERYGFENAKKEAALRQTEAYEEARQWYANEFGAANEVDSMPLPQQDIDKQDTANEWVTEFIDLDVKEEQVKTCCAKNGVGVSIPFTTAFGYTLSNYTASEQVLFSTIWHGREKEDFGNMAMMVKTLPVFIDFAKEKEVPALMQATKHQLSEARRRTVYSFAEIANDLDIHPQACFAYHNNLHMYHLILDGREQNDEYVRRHRPGLDLIVNLIKVGEGYQCKIEYNTKSYSSAFIHQMCVTYGNILRSMLTHENINDIEIVNDEQTAMLDKFNAGKGQTQNDGNDTIVSLFRKAVAAYPDNIAVVYQETKLTYRQLDEMSDKLAMEIIRRGQWDKTSMPVVSILIDRSEQMAVCALAALKAGCAYQPLDPSYPQERLNFMVKDSDAQVLICDKNLRSLLTDYDKAVIYTDEIIDGKEKTELPAVTPNSTFILLYTSGSTGTPKGVILQHHNLVVFCDWYRQYYQLTPENRVLAYASFGFDVDMMDLYPALTTGAAVVIVPEAIRLDLEILNKYIADNQVTHAFMTTQVGYQFATTFTTHPTLQHLSLGGEKLASLEPPTGYKFHNLYGPTECTVATTYHQVTHNETNIPIGQPLYALQCQIINSHGKRLPWGALGELIIIGAQVAHGYLNRPEKTAEVFFELDGKPAYRSGDIVRYRENGDIEFVGRRDGQVKIRGFRIELKEVEAVIREYEGIKDCTVQAFDEPNGGKFIAAYIVSEKKIDIQDLNRFIANQKPPYMVPATTMQLEAIPLNVNQKVDKKKLPVPERSAMSADSENCNAPLNILETEIKAIIAEILHTEDFGLTTILGYAGLTSITSIKLSMLLHKQYGVKFDSSKPLKDMTLQDIENAILKHLFSPDRNVAEETHQTVTKAPLNFSQQGVYVEIAQNPDSTIYNIPFCITIPSGFSAEQVATAMQTVVAAHPALLSHFEDDEQGGETMQTIPANISVKKPVCKTMSASDFSIYKHDFVRPFDLKNGPMYRAEVVTVDGRVYLLYDALHLVNDGGSVDIFLNELVTLLNGGSIEKETYTALNFSADQKKYEQSDSFKQAAGFFAEKIGGVENCSMLIPDIYEKTDSETRHVRFDIEPETATRIEALAKQMQVTPAGIYQAATSFAVAQYLYEDTATLATISSGRSNVDLAHTVGMFVNTLAIANKVDAQQSVRDFITEVYRNYSDSIAHEQYPYAKVAADYGFKANILYAYQVGVINEYLAGGKPLVIENLELNVPKFPVTVFVKGEGSHIYFQVEYDKALYSQAMMDGFIRALNHVAEQFSTVGMSDTIRLKDIELTDTQTVSILDSFNPDFETPYSENVVSIFRKVAATYPDNTAVVFGDQRISYRELDDISERLASSIARRIGSESKEPVVAILIHRNEMIAITSLGVLKTGATYQPLDPSYPQERLNFMIKDSNAQLLICDEDLRDIVNEYQGEVIFTKDIYNLPAAEPYAAEITPSTRFVLLYTSGSTGVPKGCQLEHGNLVTYLKFHNKLMDVDNTSKVAVYASFGFDVAMGDIFSSLVSGATLVIIPEDMRLDLPALYDYFIAEKVTCTTMTTQVGVQFLENYPNCPTLKSLCVAGEKLRSVHAENLGYQLYNGYGPSETTVVSSFYLVTKYETNTPIGRSNDNLHCYIVNKSGQRVPSGAAGELWISGDQVSRGYLNRPEKTAEVYMDDPFFPGHRLYHTGDIVRYRNDGNIEFLGRRDGQVKIRGFRIELKEVEAVIHEYEGIKDVTVQAFDNPSGGKFIAAYIVSEKKIDIQDLNRFIANQKPPYMVPATTMQIDAIPLNVNQKVDKKKLPKPQLQAENETTSAPHEINNLEKRLIELVKTLIQQEPAVNEPLAYSGMNSILSMRLSVMLFKQFNVKISGKDLLGDTSILTIENAIIDSFLDKKQDEKGNEAHPQTAEGEVVSAPLTFAQQGVYADCLMNPESTVYNIPLDICLPLSVGAEKLQKVVAQMIEMHPMLFANIYENENGDTLQSIPSSYQAKVDCQKADEKHGLDDIKRDFLRPYDLKNDRLHRAMVVETETELHLLFDVHHLVCDGGSEDIMIREMIALLNGRQPDGEAVPYMRFAAKQKAADENGEMEPYRLFFADLLKDMEVSTSIPEDKQSEEIGHLAKVAKPLPSVQIPHEQGITDATFWFAAVAYTVARYANSHDVYMTTVSNGRQDPEIADTVGMFVNTLPVTAHIKEQSVMDYLVQTAKDFHGSTQHENYPFARIAADYGYSPNIAFAYQLGLIADNSINGEPVSIQGFGLDRPKFKVNISVDMANGVPSLIISYNDAIYVEETISRLVDSILATALHISAQPEQDIRKISIISDGQMKELEGMRETAQAEISVKLFHQGMEGWAEKTPDALALVACDRTLTYAEFNREANRIAHALINKGVQPRDRVCLLLPRRSYYMLAMYAVLKAGAAYIPCDPDYPTERIRLITEDSQARFVITTKDKIENYGNRGLDIDDLLAFEGETTNPNIGITPDDLAYLIYTSGSTGRPKGVMLRHEGICNFLTAHPENRYVHAMTTECKTMLCITTVSFDLSLKELGASLFNGLTLVFANEEEVTDPQKLTDLMDKNHVDGFSGTPSRVKTFLELPAFREALSRCKYIILGGEKYPPTLLPEMKKITSARLFNSYGPTEITVSCNATELTNKDIITIGKPLLNVRESVIDMDGNELPVGVMGELYISGKGVSRGYNNLPEKTDEAFVNWNGKRHYKSGDYVRWTKEGDITIFGRKDNQIKLNGLRIELGEVETALTKQPNVKEGVVMIKSVEGHDHLVAYYVGEAETEKLKEGMSKSLTHYMVPTIFVRLDKMPISPNGKTDLKSLPEPKIAEREFVQSKNETEQFFCDLFAKILDCERVGATDNFFEIGGTSLVAIRVVIMAKQGGYDIVYKNVFDYPTPRALAELVGGGTPSISKSGNAASANLVKEDPEAADYDYTAINELLSRNTLKSLNEGTLRKTDVAIVTGATGYLGIHVMYELLENDDIKAIYCLVRGNKVQTPESRLRTSLFYYFDNTYEDQFGKRLFVLNGDVTNPADFDALEKAIDAAHYGNAKLTMFHCAANVKHFSSGTDIEDINIGGTNNCIDFCLRTGARLIHTSTHSIAGQTVSDTPVEPHVLTETQLYWGQTLNSQYTHSKFIAERNVLEAIVTKGLDAKIMRLGNLAPRSTDGEFQMNFKTNSFMGRIKALQTIGSVSYSQATNTIEFSPINEVARAVALLSATPKECCVYSPVNINRQVYNNVLICLDNLGVSIRREEPEAFASSLNVAAQNPEKAAILQSLMAYDSGLADKFVVTNTDNPNYTAQTLLRLGFSWSFTTWDYMERFINAIKGLGFFDDDYTR